MEYKLLGNSYACHTGGRSAFRDGAVRISVPAAPDGAQLRIAGRSFPITDGAVRVPSDAFCIGINRVSLSLGGVTLPAEGILMTGAGLSPAGISLPEVIRALDARYRRLGERVSLLEERIAHLESEEGLFCG